MKDEKDDILIGDSPIDLKEDGEGDQIFDEVGIEIGSNFLMKAGSSFGSSWA